MRLRLSELKRVDYVLIGIFTGFVVSLAAMSYAGQSGDILSYEPWDGSQSGFCVINHITYPRYKLYADPYCEKTCFVKLQNGSYVGVDTVTNMSGMMIAAYPDIYDGSNCISECYGKHVGWFCMRRSSGIED